MAKSSPEYTQYYAQKEKERRLNCIQLGVCYQCHDKNPADKPSTRCRNCNTANRSRTRKYDKKKSDARSRVKRKEQILSAYGGKCACCGETHPEFLTIDHIDGLGGEHRRQIGTNMYTWLKHRGFPKTNFRLLCMNCNFARRYGKTCPHETQYAEKTNEIL